MLCHTISVQWFSEFTQISINTNSTLLGSSSSPTMTLTKTTSDMICKSGITADATSGKEKFIELKLDEAIAKHCYLEKTKYELLPQVVIAKIPSHVKFTKVDKTPNMTLHTVPITPPNTPSKATLHYIISKRPISNTQQAHFKRIRKDTVLYTFDDELDDTQLLTADCN